jgi:hypothetical protein
MTSILWTEQRPVSPFCTSCVVSEHMSIHPFFKIVQSSFSNVIINGNESHEQEEAWERSHKRNLSFHVRILGIIVTLMFECICGSLLIMWSSFHNWGRTPNASWMLFLLCPKFSTKHSGQDPVHKIFDLKQQQHLQSLTARKMVCRSIIHMKKSPPTGCLVCYCRQCLQDCNNLRSKCIAHPTCKARPKPYIHHNSSCKVWQCVIYVSQVQILWCPNIYKYCNYYFCNIWENSTTKNFINLRTNFPSWSFSERWAVWAQIQMLWILQYLLKWVMDVQFCDWIFNHLNLDAD